METTIENILCALPMPKNMQEMLIRLNHQLKLPSNTKTRNEVMCRKCLTLWSYGNFTAEMIPSNHHRKKRRQYQIERLQQQIKSTETSKADVVKLTRKLKRLQQLNNHVAKYKCFCNSTTKIVLKKPAVVTSVEEEVFVPDLKRMKLDDEKVSEKKQKKKKKKMAGLIIPQNKTSNPQPSAPKSKNLSAAQLSSIMNKNTEALNKPKFNDFL